TPNLNKLTNTVGGGVSGPPKPDQPKFISTPIFHKLSGNPNTKKSLTHAYMDPALKEELFESQLLDVPGFIEHLFPDKLFPVPFAKLEEAVRKKHWNVRLEDWKGYSSLFSTTLAADRKLGAGETALSGFFNNISKTLVKACHTTDKSYQPFSKRHWVSNSNKPMSGGPQAKWKPDVCFVKEGQEVTWMSTLVTAELKSKASDASDALMQLTNSAFMIFSTQDERRFHIGVSVCHTYVCVYVFDRSGVIGSNGFHLSNNSVLLIRLLAGLTLTDVDAIGFDSSILHHEDGTRSVTVAGLEYQLLKTLFISDSIRGRGTVCWQARRGSSDYVIKNTWTDVYRMKTEADIMRMASDVEGIAHLVADEIVKHNGEDDSTSTIRSLLPKLEDYYRRHWYDKLEVRVHRRLVTSPVAESLAHFKSKKELLTVLIDAIEAHARLVEKHILHRDISMANVMIYRPLAATTLDEEAENESRSISTSADVVDDAPSTSSDPEQAEISAKGILIDLDYALVTHDESGKETRREVNATGHRTGTLPFMAIDILMGLVPGEEHQAHHDIESFFYILLWIMLQYAGPGGIERQDINIESFGTIEGWIHGNSIEEIGINKANSMMTIMPAIFKKGVINLCTPYFQDLTPCLEELRQMIFITGNLGPSKPTHQDIIAILRKALVGLPDDDNWSRDNDPAGYGPVGGKRKLETFQEVQEDDEDQDVFLPALPLAGRGKRAKTAPSRVYRTPSRKSARIQSMSLQPQN
ncbi:hypothetical protein CVT25_010366, partial [Psilocybe cyanescens]